MPTWKKLWGPAGECGWRGGGPTVPWALDMMAKREEGVGGGGFCHEAVIGLHQYCVRIAEWADTSHHNTAKW